MEKVILGNSGILVSKLGIGTGTNGSNGTSEQTALGQEKFVELLRYAYNKGVFFWDTADFYGAHDNIGKIIKDINRSEIVINTKTDSRTPYDIKNDINRFVKELQCEYLDILMLHYVVEENWLDIHVDAFKILDEAKKSGIVKAIGISCHNYNVLTKVIEADWLDVVMVRLNYAGIRMDTSPDKVIEVLRKIHYQGKGVIAMKVLGNGELVTDYKKAIHYVYNTNCVDSLVIGMSNIEQINCNVDIINNLSRKKY